MAPTVPHLRYRAVVIHLMKLLLVYLAEIYCSKQIQIILTARLDKGSSLHTALSLTFGLYF